jgi:S1-C subfamily serine protease
MMQNSVAMIGTVAMAYLLSLGPMLGVMGEGVEDGCEITQVEPNGSADKAGIKVGDIIVKFGVEPITDFPSLKEAIRKSRVNDQVQVRFFRDDKMQQVQVQLKSRQQSKKD